MLKHLSVDYDSESDILEIRGSNAMASYGEEIADGIYKIINDDNNEVIGLTIIDFSKRVK